MRNTCAFPKRPIAILSFFSLCRRPNYKAIQILSSVYTTVGASVCFVAYITGFHAGLYNIGRKMRLNGRYSREVDYVQL